MVKGKNSIIWFNWLHWLKILLIGYGLEIWNDRIKAAAVRDVTVCIITLNAYTFQALKEQKEAAKKRNKEFLEEVLFNRDICKPQGT